MTRRNFLGILVAMSSWVPSSVLLGASGNIERKNYPISAFGPYLDILLPEDSASPSATRLGVDQALLKQVRASKRLSKIIVLGCIWLDQRAQKLGAKDFAALDQDKQIGIVSAAEHSPANSLPRLFFAWTHRSALHHYYLQPESWHSLGYHGPPQPVGFLGHDQSPSLLSG